jgi:hypothetical protein
MKEDESEEYVLTAQLREYSSHDARGLYRDHQNRFGIFQHILEVVKALNS